MSYQVLARKWRPQRFEDLVGQEHVQRALVNALKDDRLHHAYLFTGTRGVGKTTISAALAIVAARAGVRTLVLTVDPARRLADALGLELEEPERRRSGGVEVTLRVQHILAGEWGIQQRRVERGEALRRPDVDPAPGMAPAGDPPSVFRSKIPQSPAAKRDYQGQSLVNVGKK